MKARSIKHYLLIVGIAAVSLLVLVTAWQLVKLQTNPPTPLTEIAKPVIKMDLQAPNDFGWLSDHEIFFLREKNQGDFLCVKADIRDGSESIIEELSPYLQDMEERGKYFNMFASPSGKRLGITYGIHTNATRVMFDFENKTATEFKKVQVTTHNNCWLPDESGWFSWIPDKSEDENKTSHWLIKPIVFSTQNQEWQVEQMVLPFLPLPPFQIRNATHLVMVQLSNNFEESEEDILVSMVPFNSKSPESNSASQLMVQNAMMTFNLDICTSENGHLWLIVHDQYANAWRVRRTPTFPFLSFDTTQLQIELWDIETKQSIMLEPDVPFKNPRHFHLNPSGTHFSFIYQGQIWVAEVAEFLDYPRATLDIESDYLSN